MNSSNPTLSVNKISVQRRKSWHAIVAGLGCGIPTLIASFLSFYAVAFFTAFIYFGNNEENLSVFERISADEILRGLTASFFIVLSVSIVLGVATAIIGGRTAYRHSVTPHAKSRLLKSLFTGIGLSVILFIPGFISGWFLAAPLFPTESFGESVFSLMILISTLVSIILTLSGRAFLKSQDDGQSRQGISVKDAPGLGMISKPMLAE